MLEKLPHWLGSALKNVRAGHDKLTVARLVPSDLPAIDLMSPAFASGARLPERFTADGEGVSPPLHWRGMPKGTARLALIVEDPDAPAPRPLVHAIVAAIDPAVDALEEGAIRADGAGDGDKDVGKNSFGSEGWLPPDPPTGHGPHDYVFQLLALDDAAPALDASPGRGDLVEHFRGHVLAAGVLVGTYSRGEEAPVGPVGAAAPA